MCQSVNHMTLHCRLSNWTVKSGDSALCTLHCRHRTKKQLLVGPAVGYLWTAHLSIPQAEAEKAGKRLSGAEKVGGVHRGDRSIFTPTAYRNGTSSDWPATGQRRGTDLWRHSYQNLRKSIKHQQPREQERDKQTTPDMHDGLELRTQPLLRHTHTHTYVSK